MTNTIFNGLRMLLTCIVSFIKLELNKEDMLNTF